ncbi:MAG: carboxypeptidase-like regulatory domain-containing protein, partial [Bacteroidetes bacterium]|nr:carboxypeptidase-like regulatory domain-containing protein [Candidatus Limisoma faecipullorum]
PEWIPPVNPSGITWLTLPVIFSNTRKQDSSIHGKVIDVNGIPIIGASIKAMDTGVHSVTDMNGNFSISITDGSILTVRYVGMKTQEVPVSIGSGPLTITLQEDVTPLMGEMVSTKTSATSAGGSSILDVVPDIDLEFPGGETALKKKLYENIDSILNERGIDIKSRIDIKGQTRILLQFIINKDGSIGEVSIALGLDEELNSVAIEAIKRLPHFIVPENARQHWSSRPIRYTIPVIFNPDKTIQQ